MRKPNNNRSFEGDIILTTACPVGCEFCIYDCRKDGKWMPESTILRVAEEFTKNDVSIRIGGGEPFMDLKKLSRCLDLIMRYQDPDEFSIITSGFFANDKKMLQDSVDILRERSIRTVLVSTDRFHQNMIPLSILSILVDAMKKEGIDVILRCTFDQDDPIYMKEIVRFCINKKIKANPNFEIMYAGRASCLAGEGMFSYESRIRSYRKIVQSEIERSDFEDLFFFASKRDREALFRKVFPTVFPNGNAYGDSQCTRSTYMGNINDLSLFDMLSGLRSSFPGYFLFNERGDCQKSFGKLFPPGQDQICQFCMDHPLDSNIPDEIKGSIYLEISPDDDYASIAESLLKDRRYLISFSIDEKHLNNDSGENVKRILAGLEEDMIGFSVVTPIPRCMLGSSYHELLRKHCIPEDCYSCNDLFRTEGLRLRSCPHIDSYGPLVTEVDDRSEIFRIFNGIRLGKKLLPVCTECIHLMRNKCDGMCFRK